MISSHQPTDQQLEGKSPIIYSSFIILVLFYKIDYIIKKFH